MERNSDLYHPETESLPNQSTEYQGIFSLIALDPSLLMTCPGAISKKTLRQRGIGVLAEAAPCSCEDFVMLAELTIGLM